MEMIASIAQLLEKIPGPADRRWPAGQRFARAMAHGSMSVELYVPIDPDPQEPHEQDELYFVAQGQAEFVLNDQVDEVAAGDVLFVPARAKHRFQKIAPGFIAWVVFWGPVGGEADAVADSIASLDGNAT